MDELIEKLKSDYGIDIKNKKLLKIAFTHSSFGENLVVESYEKLEFIGDAIIKSILSVWLYNEYSDKDEGFLSQARTQMEKNTNLINIGRKLGLHRYISHGKSVIIEDSENIIADVFESLVACVYLQNESEVVKKFVIDNCTEDFAVQSDTNYVKIVNEFFQKKDKVNSSLDSYKPCENGYYCTYSYGGMKTTEFGKNIKEAKENTAKSFYNKFLKNL